MLNYDTNVTLIMENARLRTQELRAEADHHRLVRSVLNRQTGFILKISHRLVSLLAAAGKAVKTNHGIASDQSRHSLSA